MVRVRQGKAYRPGVGMGGRPPGTLGLPRTTPMAGGGPNLYTFTTPPPLPSPLLTPPLDHPSPPLLPTISQPPPHPSSCPAKDTPTLPASCPCILAPWRVPSAHGQCDWRPTGFLAIRRAPIGYTTAWIAARGNRTPHAIACADRPAPGPPTLVSAFGSQPVG